MIIFYTQILTSSHNGMAQDIKATPNKRPTPAKGGAWCKLIGNNNTNVFSNMPIDLNSL